MDVEFSNSLEESANTGRSKTSLRMTYEAQVEVIKKQIGDLEKIRENLGLSARKMSQLLLVDPSAWTRWTKRGERPPPHIYRALQWYLTLNEKLPGLSPTYFLGGTQFYEHEKILHQLEEQKMIAETQRHLDQSELQRQIQDLKDKLIRIYQLSLFLLAIFAAFIVYYTLH